MKRIAVIVLALCLLSIHASIGYCSSIDGNNAIQMSELFSLNGIKPFDIGLTAMKAESGVSTSGFLDMFPMDAEFGEHSEKTTRFWELYDAAMNLNLIGVTIDVKDTPDYALDFVSEGETEMRVELYRRLNIADISIKGTDAKYTSVGRYVILERDLENRVFDNINAFLENF